MFLNKNNSSFKDLSWLTLSLLRARFQQKKHRTLPSPHPGKNYKMCRSNSAGTQPLAFGEARRTDSRISKSDKCHIQSSSGCVISPPSLVPHPWPFHNILECDHAPDISQWPKINTEAFTSKETVKNIFWNEQAV